eukprot:365321-Chlamydomonas_euryale.AAC.20
MLRHTDDGLTDRVSELVHCVWVHARGPGAGGARCSPHRGEKQSYAQHLSASELRPLRARSKPDQACQCLLSCAAQWRVAAAASLTLPFTDCQTCKTPCPSQTYASRSGIENDACMHFFDMRAIHVTQLRPWPEPTYPPSIRPVAQNKMSQGASELDARPC